jgi:hypothetical protein
VRFVLTAHNAAGREIFLIEPIVARDLRCALGSTLPANNAAADRNAAGSYFFTNPRT